MLQIQHLTKAYGDKKAVVKETFSNVIQSSV